MTTYTDSNCNVVKNIIMAGLMFLSLLLAVFTNFFVQANGSINDLSSSFRSPMMASFWVFSLMWCLIYIFQFLWVLYLTILTIKFASRESLFNTSFYISIILLNIGNCSITYLLNEACERPWDSSHYLLYASIICFIMDLSLYWAFFQSMVTLLSPIHTGLLPEWVTGTIRKILIVLLINALAFYVGWMTYFCNLVFSLALEHHWDTGYDAAGYVGFSLTLAFIIIYSVVNFVWLDVYFASVYTLYPALILSLTGVVSEVGVGSGAAIMGVVILGLISLLFLIKTVVNCIKAKKRSENYGILDYGYDMATI